MYMYSSRKCHTQPVEEQWKFQRVFKSQVKILYEGKLEFRVGLREVETKNPSVWFQVITFLRI